MAQERRNCCEVIEKMIETLPLGKRDFREDLEWNYEDAFYKAPEENIQWRRTQETLIKHIPNPTQDWEFEILSIFTTLSVEELKKTVKENQT